MRFDPFAFLAGISATKSQAPEELYIPDNTPTDIANGRLDQINRNANADFFEEQNEEIDATRKELRRTEAVAVMLASDRLALHRTIAFIQRKLKEGASPEQAFREAEKVRSQEFDKILIDAALQRKIEGGVKAMSGDKHRARQILVDEMPLNKKGPSYTPRRPSGPAPGY